ncbi:MAG: GNAT family N-acetyltransferase [Clostridia bacterium]|nr:GNAT family N-acetyltransferase [Clostridia bacterium]
MLKSIPIETERLILRYIESEDADDMFEYASIPEVCEYLLWSPHVNIEATKGYIEFLQKRYVRGLFGDWAVVLKEENKMIGTCGYAHIDSRVNQCEIGYVLSPKYRNKGYMTEAVNAVLELTFEKLGMLNAKLRIIKQNYDSIRLAEHIGFKLDEIIESEMEIKGVMRDIAHYSMSKAEYERKKEAD